MASERANTISATEPGRRASNDFSRLEMRRQQIAHSLIEKTYRDVFISEEIETGLPMQIRAIRVNRGWSQRELANRSSMSQEAISRLESLDYGKYTLRTLLRLAAAFDVALTIRFEAFSRVIDWIVNLRPEDLAVPSFDDDAELWTQRHLPSIDFFVWTPEKMISGGAGKQVHSMFIPSDPTGYPGLRRSGTAASTAIRRVDSGTTAGSTKTA